MFLLVDYGKVLRSLANELQQNSNASARENSTKIDCFVGRFIAFTFDLCDRFSFVYRA